MGCASLKGKVEIINPQHLTEAFREAWRTGRVEKYLMDLGWEKMIQVFNVYGQSGGGKEDIAITEAILEAVREEAKAETQGPTLLMGDVNADPSKLHNLKELVEKEGWIDVGLHVDWWGVGGAYRAKPHVKVEDRCYFCKP